LTFRTKVPHLPKKRLEENSKISEFSRKIKDRGKLALFDQTSEKGKFPGMGVEKRLEAEKFPKMGGGMFHQFREDARERM